MLNRTLFVTCLILTSALVGLSACKSESEKTRDNFQDLINNTKAVAAEVDAMGVPNSGWTPAQFDAYEAKVNQLDNLIAQVKAAGCQNNVCLKVNGDPDQIVRVLRSQLARSRSSTTSSPPNDSERSRNAARIIELDKNASTEKQEIVGLGEPNSGWSIEQLQNYLQKVENLKSKYSETSRLVDNSGFTSVQSSAVRSQMEQNISVLNEVRDDVNKLIGQKAGKENREINQDGSKIAPNDRVKALSEEAKALEQSILAQGIPDSSWDGKKLDAYSLDCARVGTKYDEMEALIKSYRVQIPSADNYDDMIKQGRTAARFNMLNASLAKLKKNKI